MSPFREVAVVVPEHLWEPKWHQRARCRLFGHALHDLFVPAPRSRAENEQHEFPAYCTCCGHTERRGYSAQEYWTALERWKRWSDSHVRL